MNQNRSLIHIIPSNKWGGIQSYALDICRHYRSQGWEVTALTRNAVGVDSHFAENEIRLVHAPLTGFFNIPSALILARELKTTVKTTKKFSTPVTAITARITASITYLIRYP